VVVKIIKSKKEMNLKLMNNQKQQIEVLMLV